MLPEEPEPSSEEINHWLAFLSDATGYAVRRMELNHWQLDMNNSFAPFTLDIYELDEWISFGILLMHDIQGQGKAEFYKYLLERNAELYGAHLAIQGDLLILIKEDLKTGFDPKSLANSIRIMNTVHQTIYPQLLGYADN